MHDITYRIFKALHEMNIAHGDGHIIKKVVFNGSRRGMIFREEKKANKVIASSKSFKHTRRSDGKLTVFAFDNCVTV